MSRARTILKEAIPWVVICGGVSIAYLCANPSTLWRAWPDPDYRNESSTADARDWCVRHLDRMGLFDGKPNRDKGQSPEWVKATCAEVTSARMFQSAGWGERHSVIWTEMEVTETLKGRVWPQLATLGGKAKDGIVDDGLWGIRPDWWPKPWPVGVKAFWDPGTSGRGSTWVAYEPGGTKLWMFMY